ncbi:MAG: Gfo/Idh/MocA family oxidoreductase [Verrucomicrobia bacterium]|nr:Gfo/Idh/MocA family oxidoreductase [Verrucomicrobiota bacterium]
MRVFADYDQILADPDLEAVVISLPNSLHSPATLNALTAGKHILCEKPPISARGSGRIICTGWQAIG